MSKAIEQRRGVAWWSGVGRAGRFLWEAIWVPYWLGSTMPPPSIPGRSESRTAAGERTPQILQQLDIGVDVPSGGEHDGSNLGRLGIGERRVA